MYTQIRHPDFCSVPNFNLLLLSLYTQILAITSMGFFWHKFATKFSATLSQRYDWQLGRTQLVFFREKQPQWWPGCRDISPPKQSQRYMTMPFTWRTTWKWQYKPFFKYKLGRLVRTSFLIKPMFTIAHSTNLPFFAILFLSMVLLLHVCFIRSKIAVSLLTFYKYHIDFLKSCKFKIQKSSIFIVPTCVNKKYNSSLF